MGAEIPSNAASLQEFKSEVSPLKRIVEVALTFLAGKISDQDTHLRSCLANRAEIMFSHNGSLDGLTAVIEGREELNKYLADDVSEIRDLVEFFQIELVQAIGSDEVQAAIATLRKIENCDVVKAKAKEYQDTRKI